MVTYNDLYYFNSLGYKALGMQYAKIIVEDFQRHTNIKVDGVIGPQTRGQMRKYNQNNYCPEVFEPIVPYTYISSEEIEAICNLGLENLGYTFNIESRLHNMNVIHNIAHAVLESATGTSYIARKKNNLYGWRAYDSSAFESATGFKSKEDCIKTWTREYVKSYLTPGGKEYRGNNEYCVNIRYATSPIAGVNKSFIVRDLRRKLNGNQ